MYESHRFEHKHFLLRLIYTKNLFKFDALDFNNLSVVLTEPTIKYRFQNMLYKIS
jgi:hypothetical protein